MGAREDRMAAGAVSASKEAAVAPMPRFNENRARAVQANVLGMVQRLEKAHLASQRQGLIAVPDSAPVPAPDPEKVLIAGTLQIGMAVVCILDLLLELRTGQPGLFPDPNAPKEGPRAE